MNKQEAYVILGLQENASDIEIKKAFKKLAVEKHPDKNPNNPECEEEFKKINQAYRILLNLESVPQQSNEGMGVNFNRAWQDIFFEQFFNSRKTDDFIQNKHKKQNIEMSVSTSFEESVLGCKKEIVYDIKKDCEHCFGSGVLPEDKIGCANCNGTGYFEQIIKTGYFTKVARHPCTVCSGRGVVFKKVCKFCEGKTYFIHNKKISVSIPAIGGETTILYIKGGGNVYCNHLNPSSPIISDLYLKVIPTVFYNNLKLEHNNIIVFQDVSFEKLLFGGEIDIKVLDNNYKLIIPSKPVLSNTFVIQDKGVNYLQKYKKPGDILVNLRLKYPDFDQIDEKTKEDTKNILQKIYKV